MATAPGQGREPMGSDWGTKSPGPKGTLFWILVSWAALAVLIGYLVIDK